MSKALTIEAIEAKALEVFCREGFDRASLRAIAQEAGVPLSSIHVYFRSKADLYLQVSQRIFEMFDTTRLALLREAQRRGEPVSLERIVHCLVAPMILSRYKHPSDLRRFTQVVRSWLDTTTYLESDPRLRDDLRRSVEHWIGLLRTACPGLDATSGHLAYCLISSTLYQWEANHHYMNRVLGVPGEVDEEEQCDKLVLFIAGGIRSLAA